MTMLIVSISLGPNNVEIESKEGRKTAQLVIKQLQQMTAYRKFRK
jgi:hypothetical protein